MAKISALTDGAPAVGTDIVPVARGSGNRRLTIANLFASPTVTGVLTAGSDNAVDIGDSTTGFRTGYYETSVITPLVTAASTVNVAIRGTGAGAQLILGSASNNRWIIDASGHLIGAADATYNVGGTAERPLQVFTSKAFLGGTLKTLTESAATDICDIAVAASAFKSGVLFYTIEAADATNTQCRTGSVPFSAVANSSGTVTAAVGTATEVIATSSGTLTVAVTNTAGAGKMTLALNAVSSLTQTTLRARWHINSPDQNIAITVV